MIMQAEPTEQDVSTLARALFLEDRYGAGIFPRDGAQTSHFRKLVRLGMLTWTGEWGRDVDSIVDRDVPLYRLTDDGRAWIQRYESMRGGEQ